MSKCSLDDSVVAEDHAETVSGSFAVDYNSGKDDITHPLAGIFLTVVMTAINLIW